MRATHFSFRVGSIPCTVLLDGSTVIGEAGIVKRFLAASEADYRRAYAEIGLSLDEAESSLNILLLTIGAETILVDAGEGGRPKGGYLLENLRQAAIAPETITQVIITHTHGDHVLGLLSDVGEPLFPNASYIISKTEMAFWRDRIEAGVVDQGPLVRMIEARGLRLIEMDEPLFPGLTALPLPGHTPGQIGLLVESGPARLLHLADLLHSPMQFAHPVWSPSFDVDTELSVPTRQAMLGRAADERVQVLFYHLTFPGLGWVQRAAQGFSWHPHRV